jgi:hypothetical protein
MTTYAIGPVPTPNPPKGVSYTPQLSGGQIYDDQTNVITNPTSSYALPGGAPEPIYTSSNTYVTPKTTSTSTPTPTTTVTQEQPKTNTSTTNFDDVYNAMYPGWDRNSAYQDWIAKGRPSPSNSGGSSKYSDFVSKNPYSDITPGWNPDDFAAELENIYNQALNYSNQQKGFAEQSRAGNVADIENQFGVSKGTLDTSKGQTLETLGQSEISSRQQQEQSLDSIRRLYNEMMMGYQQRFGGASSAGEAAKALAGQEMQRQMGTTRQSTSNALRQIETQKVQVEENYKNSLLDLENKKNTAINEANRNFQSAILSIDNDIKTAANEKSLAKMNLLKEYKTDLFNIKQQEAAWKANLETMKAQADLQTESALKQLQASASAGSSALDTLKTQATTNPTSGLGVGSTALSQAALQGQISKDDLQNYLGQIRQTRTDIPLWMQQ